MGVQTEFWNYQVARPFPDPNDCSPLLDTLLDWLLNTRGGMDLGCYGERPIVGGTTLSTHASGAAFDWRYAFPGPGRDVMLTQVMPILLNRSDELGIQAVHDYVASRIWRPPGTSGRPPGGVENGWQAQRPGTQMGQSWALWLHIEVLPVRWADRRSVAELLHVPVPPPVTPAPCVPDFAQAVFCDWPKRDKNTQNIRDKNPTVGYWQGVAKFRIANFALVYGTVADNIGKGITPIPPKSNHSRGWYRDRAKEMFKAHELCAALVVDNMFGSNTSKANAAVKVAFDGRTIAKRVLRFKGGGDVIGQQSFWLADHVADGKW